MATFFDNVGLPLYVVTPPSTPPVIPPIVPPVVAPGFPGGTAFDNVGIVSISTDTTPGAPTNLVVVAGDKQLTVSFVPPTNHGNSGIDHYIVEVTPSPGNITTTSTSITVSGLTNQTLYSVVVRAVSASGLSSSNSVSVNATPSGVPIPPGPSPVPINPPSDIPDNVLIPGPGPGPQAKVRVAEAPVYNISIGDWQKGDSYELTQLSNRSLHFNLLDPNTFSFDISGLPDLSRNDRLDASLLREGVSDVTVRRNGVPLFLGRLMTTSDNVGVTDYTITCSCSDYRELLNHRMLIANKTFNSMTGEAIIWQLITDTQTLAPLGITKGLWPASKEVYPTRSFEQGKPVFDAIKDLTKATTTSYITNTLPGKLVVNTFTGFDFDIDTSRKANAYIPGKGQDQGVVLDYGGTISALTRSVDMNAYANYILETGSLAGYSFPVFSANLATRPEGRWDALVANQDLPDAASIAKAGAISFLEKSSVVSTYNLTFGPGKWLGPNHVWIGDMVRVHANIGRLKSDGINDYFRVTEISITLDQSNRETVTVTCGRSIPRYIKSLKETVSRLNRR